MKTRIRKNESGMASLVIAILIVIIVTTIVLGFMQIIRREQRRSLDNQLSSQAYYAAESGVNNAIKAVRQEGFTSDKTQCAPFLTGALGATAAVWGTSNLLTADGNVQYSCLLINQSPTSLAFDKVSTSHSNVFPVRDNAPGRLIDSLTFTWANPTGITSSTRLPSGTGYHLPPVANWNSLGLLRVDIMPAASVSKWDLIGSVKTLFMYPSRGGGATTYSYIPNGVNSGNVVDGKCNPPNGDPVCSVTVNNLKSITGIQPGDSIYVRVLAMYEPVKLTITATDDTGASTGVSGAQILVDSTGKAADVLRRIQVRVPFQDTDYPDYAIASMDSLCKKFFASADGTVTSEVPADLTCNPNP
jgi:Tfp pilus assembly protein FimT